MLIFVQGCCSQMQTAQEAMASKPPGQGRDVYDRKRLAYRTGAWSARRDCRSQVAVACAQGLPGGTASGLRDLLPATGIQLPPEPLWHGDSERHGKPAEIE